ncbi:MAG TPA: hypothetical protein ENI99_07745 [Sedimenticola sp.]|nr:hypothetical protein [Sedimenticola sp.]
MSETRGQRRWEEQRRCHYVDVRIQGGLVAALVLFEAVVLGAAMLVLYYNLDQVIEEQLYRIHITPRDGMPVLVSELFALVPYIIFANVAVVLCIDWAWSRYVNRIIEPLKERLRSAGSLDLRAMPAGNIRHEVLDKADAWVQEESRRYRKLQRLAAGLSAEMDSADALAKIEQMRRLLPPPG